jgi:hypothetical protein
VAAVVCAFELHSPSFVRRSAFVKVLCAVAAGFLHTLAKRGCSWQYAQVCSCMLLCLVGAVVQGEPFFGETVVALASRCASLVLGRALPGCAAKQIEPLTYVSCLWLLSFLYC